MPRIEFVPVTDDHIEWVATFMRAADRAECEATGQTDMVEVLRSGCSTSVMSWCATIDGEPALIMGVAPMGTLLGRTGVPWLLGTDAVPRHARALMRHMPLYIEKMAGAFSHLLNFVHAENKTAIGWLKRMGFSVESTPLKVPPHGALFHQFEVDFDVQPRRHPLRDHGRQRRGAGQGAV